MPARRKSATKRKRSTKRTKKHYELEWFTVLASSGVIILAAYILLR